MPPGNGFRLAARSRRALLMLETILHHVSRIPVLRRRPESKRGSFREEQRKKDRYKKASEEIERELKAHDISPDKLRRLSFRGKTLAFYRFGR